MRCGRRRLQHARRRRRGGNSLLLRRSSPNAVSSSPACTRSSRLALAAARSTAPSPACLARSQAPTAPDNELIELPAAARAAGGQALTEPKLEHFCIAFCRTRRAERRAAAAPARRAHPSRCARHSNRGLLPDPSVDRTPASHDALRAPRNRKQPACPRSTSPHSVVCSAAVEQLDTPSRPQRSMPAAPPPPSQPSPLPPRAAAAARRSAARLRAPGNLRVRRPFRVCEPCESTACSWSASP